MLDQNLVNAVKESLNRGETKEKIYQNWLAQSKTVQDISDALEAAGAESHKVETQKRTISAVVIIGAILIGAGIFSFIASNWERFGKPLKLSIILISMFLSYGAGWYIKEVKSLKRTGTALILLGGIIYGAGIFLVAQMFNIRANWPDGFILWMLGLMALSFAIDFTGQLYFAWVLGLIAIFGGPFIIFDSFSGYNPLLLTSTLLLILTTAVCFYAAIKFRKKMPPEQKEIY